MHSKTPWHFDVQTKTETKLEPGKRYTILPASDEDKAKVVQFYANGPVEGYDVSLVEVIFNPGFNRAFTEALTQLQEKHGNTAFEPKWEQMQGAEQRAQVKVHWDNLTKPYTDPQYPNVKLLPAWHGTRPELLDSIIRIGYSNLSYTDEGFFGKGLYSAYEAEYAYRVYYKGTLIMNWVASFSALPVIYEDMSFLKGKGNYGNYDAHFVPVVPKDPLNPNEVIYYPCKAGEKARYHELVVFQTIACLPRYLVQLQKTLLKSPSTPSPEVKDPQIKTKNLSNPTNITWQAVVQMASGIWIDESTQMIRLYFPVPPKGYWTRWQEHITEIYEQLKSTVKMLQQWKTADDQTQIFCVKATDAILGYCKAYHQTESKPSINLTDCIKIDEYENKPKLLLFEPVVDEDIKIQKLVKGLQMGGNPQRIEDVVRSGLNVVPYRDDKGNSFLHLLAQTRFAQYVVPFLQLGFRLMDANYYGDIALHYACGQENLVRDPQGDMVLALIKSGSVIDTRNKQEQTPLMVAARCGHIAAARALMEAGANKSLVDAHGQTAVLIARSSELPEKEGMIDLLEQNNSCTIS
jgi:hypothetical protein